MMRADRHGRVHAASQDSGCYPLKGPVLEQAAPGWFRMIRVPVLSPFSEKKEPLTIKRTVDVS